MKNARNETFNVYFIRRQITSTRTSLACIIYWLTISILFYNFWRDLCRRDYLHREEIRRGWTNSLHNEYHRRVKEAPHKLFYNSNAPDPDQSWPECFWKCSFPSKSLKAQHKGCYRGLIARVKSRNKEFNSFWESQRLLNSDCNLVLLSKK